MKKRKLNSMGKIAIFACVLIVVGLSILFYLFCRGKKLEEHIIVQEKNYVMKIDYPYVRHKQLDQEIQTYVENQKTEFVETVADLEVIGETPYSFTLQYQVSEREELATYHFIVYAYTGGNHDMRDDKTYHYNRKTKEIVDLSYFLVSEDSLSKLSTLAYYYVKQFSEGKDVPEQMIKSGTEAKLENYQHFSFQEDGLKILFPPYQVGPWCIGEVKITIPYEELQNIIKPEYLVLTKEEAPLVTTYVRDIEPFRDKKLLAFTFDDGPSSQTTNYLLDRLDTYQARVTFFVLGSRVDQCKDTMIKAYQQGNQIGSHTYYHRNLLKLDEYGLLTEIKNTNDEIRKILGVSPTLLRPPYGNTNDAIKKTSDMHTILWNIDTLDWKYKDKYKIADEIVKNARDGSIVLLHDIYQSSVEGALLAMEKLQKEGYAFVTIDEMAKLKGISLDKTTSYFEF